MLPERVQCVTEKVGEETLVYHRGTAHCLNPEASLVFEHCDGQSTLAEVALKLPLPQPTAHEFIELTLRELAKKKLLKGKVSAAVTRRTFMKRWGTVACALPLITSVVAPQPASAQSCVASTGCTRDMCQPCTTGVTGGGCDDCVCLSFYCSDGGDGCDLGDRFLGVGCVSQADLLSESYLSTSCGVAKGGDTDGYEIDTICGFPAATDVQLQLCIDELGGRIYGCCECPGIT